MKLKKHAKNWLGIAIAISILGMGYWFHKNGLSLNKIISLKKSSIPESLDFSLEEASQELGIENKHLAFDVHKSLSTLQPFLAFAGSSAAVVDYNNDGWQDIYVTNSKIGSKNKLFKNLGNGSFNEVAENVGLAEVNKKYPSYRSLFFDFDNDGDRDALLLSYCPKLFLNEGGKHFKFKEVIKDSGLPCGQSFSASILSDFDGDGYLDLVLAPYHSTDLIHNPVGTDILSDSFFNATNGTAPVALKNIGGKYFQSVKDNFGLLFRGWTNAIGSYSFAPGKGSDLWFAIDFSHERLFRRTPDGTFSEASKDLVRDSYSRNGMGVEIADIDNDGKPLIFVSHIYGAGQKPAGNTLWKQKRGDTFQEISKERGVNNCGWAWGSKFLDLNNDGNLDLIVGNGFISANPKKSYWYPLNTLDASSKQIVKDLKFWPPIKDASLAGFQRACVFLNLGNGKFVDVAEKTGLKNDVSDERSVSSIDIMNDGNLSVVFSNHKQPLKLYRLKANPENHWIGFTLEGTESNRDAFGASIQLRMEDGTVLERQVQPLNGYMSQSDSRVHFGLGKRKNILSLKIIWPDGKILTLDPKEFKINSYNLVREQR